jgi:hypothetical protein
VCWDGGAGGYGAVVRAIRTPFIDQWQVHRDEARQHAERLRGEVIAAVRPRTLHELMPVAGQSAPTRERAWNGRPSTSFSSGPKRATVHHHRTLVNGRHACQAPAAENS